jgi:hypothetical protein
MLPVQSARSFTGRQQLVAIVVCVAALWLVLLPRVSKLSPLRTLIDRNERLGIDPSAKFYSELPLMKEMLRRITMEDTKEKQ